MSGTITTSVPAPVFGATGFVAPAESDIFAGVQSDINAAFGGGLSANLETPQGQLASSMTAIIGDANDQFLALANSVDPAYASGRMQDGIARIYFITRNPALSTEVIAVCTGLPGVVIPIGARALAVDGNIYICNQNGTISAAGSVTLSFACSVTGPITCPAGNLNTIYQVIPGWDTITNPADGIVGTVVESRADFEFRRNQSVANNARGFLASILGAVLQVPDVIDAYVNENSTTSPVTVGGVSIAANSLYVCVAGGAAAAVAAAIYSKKPPGCGYTGNTTVVIADPNQGYTVAPTYPVTFQVPTPVTVFFGVKIANSSLVPSNAAVLVQNAILSAFAGADGGARARIGGTVYASRFYGGIAALGQWAEIVSVLLATTATANFLVCVGSISGNILTVSSVSYGGVQIGTFLTGTGIASGTTVIAFGSGAAGQAGTYTVSVGQTASSETITGFFPYVSTVSMGINQIPVVSAQSISVSLV